MHWHRRLARQRELWSAAPRDWAELAEPQNAPLFETLLAIARERTPDGDFREAGMDALPFGDAAFDVVALRNVFRYVVAVRR